LAKIEHRGDLDLAAKSFSTGILAVVPVASAIGADGPLVQVIERPPRPPSLSRLCVLRL
jgi:hypothetical protein